MILSSHVVFDCDKVSELTKMRIVAFACCRESLAAARRDGVNLVIQIKECSQWQVICVDPEHLRDKDWRIIAASPIFRASYLFTVIDEAHLINMWGVDLRKAFQLIGLWVRGCLPPSRSVVALSVQSNPGPFRGPRLGSKWRQKSVSLLRWCH
jgi:superfamily II DNA helicase RecQ